MHQLEDIKFNGAWNTSSAFVLPLIELLLLLLLCLCVSFSWQHVADRLFHSLQTWYAKKNLHLKKNAKVMMTLGTNQCISKLGIKKFIFVLIFKMAKKWKKITSVFKMWDVDSSTVGWRLNEKSRFCWVISFMFRHRNLSMLRVVRAAQAPPTRWPMLATAFRST